MIAAAFYICGFFNYPTPLHLLVITFYVIIGIQIVYCLAFIIAISTQQEKGKPKSLPVSVIVCAHDEENNLRELIPILLAQDHVEFEIVIVDDRSNDATVDLLLKETAKDHRLKMVRIDRTPPHANSKKYALTMGIKAARYEWILLTDADCRPAGNAWISTMSSRFGNATEFVLGYSPYLEKSGILNAFIRFETLLTAIQYISFALLGNPFMGVGRNLAYRKSMFFNAKGFNNALQVTGGDDDLFVNQHAHGNNTAVCFTVPSQVFSIPESTWGTFYKQKVRHLSVGKRYRFSHQLLLGVFSITWILTWFIGIPLIFFSFNNYVVAGLLLLRMILVTLTIRVFAGKLGQKFEIWIIPLLDFIYAFYYLVTGLRALVISKVEWKN
ncbi:MAG: glycosyltransferase [Cyclobacteriaceae bacterium]|nr:glycosyltransferase [Cyclobacteriaceae bacterium]MDH4296316.1 glycosyltransferase [Cyclobacteriaceae bacterium]MDH5249544.1 glycosyltransferase [Cyclobacteriaceae bacterium]